MKAQLKAAATWFVVTAVTIYLVPRLLYRIRNAQRGLCDCPCHESC